MIGPVLSRMKFPIFPGVGTDYYPVLSVAVYGASAELIHTKVNPQLATEQHLKGVSIFAIL